MKTIIILTCLLLGQMEDSKGQIYLQNQDSFTIIGKTKGFKDSTKLYFKKLEDGSLKDNLDSTIVINNSFTFKGKVSEPAIYSIHTGYTGWKSKRPPETFFRLSFWLSNSTIYVNDEVGNLKYAKISGSQLQDDCNEYNQAINPLYSTLDSIGQIIDGLTPADSVRNRMLRTNWRKLNAEKFNSEISFIKTHPKSIISTYLLNIYKTTLGKDASKDLYLQMDPQIRNTIDGKSIKGYIGFPDVRIGDKYVDIELPDLDGKPIKLSSLKNKYILLEFWAGWCGGCRLENPKLLSLYNKYKEKGFEIYGVSLDDKREGWKTALTADKINWITVSDLKPANYSEAASIYNVQGIPSNYLINNKGIIIAQDLGGEELEKKLNEIFKE